MKDIISIKFPNSFLFSVICILMLCPLVVVNAQPRSASINSESKVTSTNLINTLWKIPDVAFDTDLGRATATCFYFFEKYGKVSRREIAILPSQMQATPNYQNPMYNPQINPWIEGGDPNSFNNPNRMALSSTPGLLVQIDEIGTYKVTDSSIKIDFSGICKNCHPHSITAKIQNEEIYGEYLNKKTNEKSTFKIVKMMKPSEVSSNKANNLSNNTSSQLSLSESQNSYYKPSPLTKNIISGRNPEGSLNYLNYSFVADSGEITFTFSLNASQESFASSVSIEVQDSKNNVVAEKFVVTNRGKTEQSSVSIKIPEKQALLLRIKLSGGGSYQVRLSGAVILN